jgi:sulfatase modifying factor 1
MKVSRLLVLSLCLFVAGDACAGITGGYEPKSKNGKSKLKVKDVEMTPSLADELAYTNILVIVNSNNVLDVDLGPCEMEGKFKKKTGEAKSWKWKLKLKEAKQKAEERKKSNTEKYSVKYTPKKNSLKAKTKGSDMSSAVLIYAPGKAAVMNEMVTIPAGKFWMGASNRYFIAGGNDVPVHEVDVSEFMIEKHETSNGQVCNVLNWANANGKLTVTAAELKNNEGTPQLLIDMDNYACDIKYNGSVFYAEDARDGFPCSVISWYGAQAYCNYKSDMEGLQRCIDFTGDDWTCDLTKSGNRLPTEAEWEKAARGGLVANWYPWPSTGPGVTSDIDGSKANYFMSGGLFDHEIAVCGYFNGGQIPAGVDMANGYGLYDMCGNVEEWCYDWYDNLYYQSAGATAKDTMGPPKGFLLYKVLRGGAWGDNPAQGEVRIAQRDDAAPTHSAFRGYGFRCVKRPTP